jgi:hypothetical protein
MKHLQESCDHSIAHNKNAKTPTIQDKPTMLSSVAALDDNDHEQMT